MFTSIRTNPFLQWELRQSSIRKGINWSFIWLRVIPLIFLTLIALIPTQYYIDDSRIDWLPWMALILFAPRPLLILKTIVSTVESVNNEMNAQRWELLILTGIPAPKIVWGKWIRVVRQTTFDYVLFSLPRIGLALGLAEYLNSMMVYPPYPYPRRWPFILSEYTYFAQGAQAQLYPSTTVFILGCLIIILFGILECGIVTAIGVAVAFVWKQRSFIVYLVGIGYYIVLLLLVFIIWNYLLIGSRLGNFSSTVCDPRLGLPCNFVTAQTLLRITDTIQLGFQTPLDQGTLLATNIMRPNDTRRFEFKSKTYPGKTYLQENNYDNRPFVARNLVAALVGIGVYWFIVRYFLRRATRFAVVNHGASGYLEL